MSLRSLKLLLVIIGGCLVVATAYISLLVLERQDALKQVSRYNTAWLASQAVSELTRLEQRISAFRVAETGVDKNEVQLRYEIMQSRMSLLNDGEFQDFVSRDPERRAAVRSFNEAVVRLGPLIEDIDTPGRVAEALAILAPLQSTLARLASAANRFGAERVAEDQQELIRLHWLFSSVVVGLLLCGIGLLTLLGWHNRLLERAQQALHRLTQSLRSTSDELEVRNELLEAREIELRSQNERFDAALNNMSHGLCMVSADDRMIVCNERFSNMFHLPAAIQPGTPVSEIIRMLEATEGSAAEALRQVHKQHRALVNEGRRSSFIQGTPDGQILAVSHQPMPDSGWLATYDDVTERQRAEAQIAYMAHHDALTDLANRVLFREKMAQALAKAERDGTTLAVLFLDLDRFKDVNDTLGHQTGDMLLKAVADRLRSCVREDDVIARLGGDEFGVLQVGAYQLKDCATLAGRIVDLVSSPYELEGHEIVIGTTVGIAVGPNGSSDPDELLKQADLALYRAKGERRGTFRFFEPEMDAELQARRGIERDLRRAMESEEFELYYQPQIDVKRQQISGFEALLRWHHPERGMVSPAEFIPIAEDIGLIAPLGEWIIRQACAEAATWPTRAAVAVNLSPAQFRNKNLVQTVISALASSQLSPARLELEITESVLLQENDTTLASLHQLRELGVRIAMDDFGTGYSSLSYLRSFPFDKIKIDQSFIRELSTRADCLAIVQSIIALGASLGMATSAEGVETEEQFLQLQLAGCTEVQGYYFGRPQPASKLTHHLARSAAA